MMFSLCFNTLTDMGKWKSYQNFGQMDVEKLQVKKFVSGLLPDEVTQGKNVTDRGRILVNIAQYFIPDDILRNDEFFRAMALIKYLCIL